MTYAPVDKLGKLDKHGLIPCDRIAPRTQKCRSWLRLSLEKSFVDTKNGASVTFGGDECDQ
ncbi:hypothetical protein Plhal304r1_c052g0136551 [Plasmopara halstedii]